MSNKLCAFPWVHMSANQQGEMIICCNTYQSSPIKKDNGHTWKLKDISDPLEYFNSEHYKEIRKDMLQGKEPEYCKKCIDEDKGSMRYRSIREYVDNYEVLSLVQDTIENDYVAKHSLKRLELKPSNLCNLKCVMCNSYDSTQVAKELRELSEKYGGIKIYNGRFIEISNTPGIKEYNSTAATVEEPEWSDVKEIWENFERLVPNLETLSFAGGEPTIMPSVLKALQYCVDSGYAKNITIYLSSNFTNLNKNFFELMKHYKRFELISSIDGYDLVNDYCRFPSKWRQVSKNYIEAKKFTEYKKIKLMTNITVSCLNVLNLTDLLNWIEERSLEQPYFFEWPYHINLLLNPIDQQVSILPDHIKALAKERLETYLKTSIILKNPNSALGLDVNIHMLINELKKPSDPVALQRFKNRIKVLDNHRNIYIGNYIPELSEVFKW